MKNAQAVQANIENKQIGSQEFWRITNVPTIINDPEVIYSSTDKAKLLNFA